MASQVRDALRDTSFDAIHSETDRSLERSFALQGRAGKRRREAAAASLVGWDGRPRVAIPRAS